MQRIRQGFFESLNSGQHALPPLYSNDDRSKGILVCERFPAADVLKIEGHSLRHPEPRLDRSATAAGDEQRTIRTADANFDGLHARRHPTDGGHTEDGVTHDRYWIRTGS